jgi:hypothetical protein
MAKLKTMLTTGKLISGRSELTFTGGSESDDTIFIPPGLDEKNIKTPPRATPANNNNNPNNNDARQLSTSLQGTKPILVVRVTDSEGRVTSDISEVISTNIFGTSSPNTNAPGLGSGNNGNPNEVNLKSVLEECSQNLITVTPSDVLDVTIPISLTDESYSRTAIRNSITTAVQDTLGHELPGPYDHVIYILEGCHNIDCGFMAYAYINSWNVVVIGTYYTNVGLMLHEVR